MTGRHWPRHTEIAEKPPRAILLWSTCSSTEHTASSPDAGSGEEESGEGRGSWSAQSLEKREALALTRSKGKRRGSSMCKGSEAPRMSVWPCGLVA